MSYNLNNARVGDLLVCYLWYALKPEELLGKFIVVSKGSSEANNNKNDDNTVLTLHIIYRDLDGMAKYLSQAGTNFTIPLEYLNHEVYRWNLDYRPEEG